MLQGIVGMDSPYNQVDFWAVSCKYVKPEQADMIDFGFAELVKFICPINFRVVISDRGRSGGRLVCLE